MDPLERVIIRAKSGDNEYIPLSPLDIYLGHFVTGLIYFFLKSPDIRRLKEALALALDRHPSFGASMVREANSIGLNCGAAGIELSIYRCDMCCPNLRSTESLATAALLIDDDVAIHSPNGERDADDSSATLSQGAGNYPFNRGLPIVRFRLVLFKDNTCALIARYVHSHGDGTTLTNFLSDWSTIYREEIPSPISGYSRASISGLADPQATQPSGKMNIVQKTSDSREPLTLPKNPSSAAMQRQGGALRIDIAQSTLENFILDCRLHSTLTLSSSDVIHALAWKCFAWSQSGEGNSIDSHSIDGLSAEDHFADGHSTYGHSANRHSVNENTAEGHDTIRLYTLFDLRGIKALGIPADYEGSAILGRWAEASRTDLLIQSVADIAITFRHQTKPIDPNDIYKDIGYLAHEYAAGHIDANGNFSRFTIGAWIDCRSAQGLIVNDLRRLGEKEIHFEERPARMETLVSHEINIVSVYQNDDGTATLHYVGELSTLDNFAVHLKRILQTGGA